MRLSCVAIFLVACSSNGAGEPDGSIAVTCSMTIANYCQGTPCDMTLSAATSDRSLCPASRSVCGSYTEITQMGIDTSRHLYYSNGQLVAIEFNGSLVNGHTCVAGPSTFDVPSCLAGDPLPVCTTPSAR
jgi:hypothetical protein